VLGHGSARMMNGDGRLFSGARTDAKAQSWQRRSPTGQ
jgi:hypothetical protein